jgi:hypothetical protein
MRSIQYCAAWTECGCFISCGHSHGSVREDVACIRVAGAYVVAVDAGTMRCLNVAEEAEFQFAIHNRSAARTLAVQAPAVAVSTGVDRCYAVMTRIRFGDNWSWTTWMCFETFAEASAHAREGDKVVDFRSAEWQELRQQTAAAPPGSNPCAANDPLPNLEGEALVEFVFRLLGSCADLRLQTKLVSITSEGINGDATQRKKCA